MTPQEIFDTSVNHIRQQGCPSTREPFGDCAYKGANGTSCAAAPFITRYDRVMEGQSWRGIVQNYPDCVQPDAADNVNLVFELQFAHDTAACEAEFLPKFETYAAAAAAKFNLTYTPPETADA